ncbi:hypothetical protein [Anaerobium acetethylicum]|uniref:Uncharacterized protein n=1 Tax=Anaerobium acetethylicum TaxID=1619234 RepID=A0A1D3TUN6_9FIRM|nr:hypothetical protein [Anaerobium acetethylicum]SCP97774.1 hypothetical protein SAMN05421730_101379 [Anaerobium acetethylicum]
MSESKNQKKWDRDEVVVLVAEYFRTKNMIPKEIDDNYRRISSILRKRESEISGNTFSDVFRNYSGIRMQSGRIRCLDPESKYNGMIVTKIQKEIVDEFMQNPEKIYKEAKAIIAKYEHI